MRIKIFFIILFTFICSCAPIEDNIREERLSLRIVDTGERDILLVDDFDEGTHKNYLGGGFGAWDYRPYDRTQGASVYYTRKEKLGEKGFSVAIKYDVDSPSIAFNGFWMKLNGIDVSSYSKLVFWIKPDPKKGCTKIFKIELKNKAGEVGKYYVKGIKIGEWQQIIIPLSEFEGISSFNEMDEFIIVFENRIVTQKVGKLYLDMIYFSK